jgi:hypothetical protein
MAAAERMGLSECWPLGLCKDQILPEARRHLGEVGLRSMSSLLLAEKTGVRSVIVEKDALQPVLEGSLKAVYA